MNAELSEGMTDGKYKKLVADRGGIGVTNSATLLSRTDLNDVWYGRHEAMVKDRPDGQTVPTPNYVSTPPAQAGF
ncbi:hypothetical protein PV336_16120 [Streptomyces sp. MI02-2A]|uniref:hypothetical protein n=1 Tax=Streptomyces sp. MI02-2A TaxID=3028688 RepID=UPI0029A7A2AF|nr:hypothetical protein [Streptomyces sp. MI02-2A]MDX3260747.1 hypothetical protein [Streptomyces sp. MI02-2A]